MENLDLDCLSIRCPPRNHPFHDVCHIEGHRLNYLKEVILENKENIPPCWIEDFGARDLALAVLYYECEEENDYSFYAFKLRQFNDLMSEYLEV